MHARSRFVIILTIFCLAILFGSTLARAQGGEKPGQARPVGRQVYFPETGHTVSGEFLVKYQSVENPLQLYGYPITEAFQDPLSGDIIQYFQRTRFELHPEQPDALKVQLTPLGEYLYEVGNPRAWQENTPACRLYAETGKQVCRAFLEFFDKHGGVAQFGSPISDAEIQEERMVQYFSYARFEWHPEYPSGQRVVLSNLGSRYFEVHGEDPIRLRPVPGNNIAGGLDRTPVISLKARAFTRTAVTAQHGSQTAWVVVLDQNGDPVSNAQVILVVTLPDGQQGRYVLDPTNESGVTTKQFNFKSASQGLAKVWVRASLQEVRVETVTSFRIWW